MLSCGNYIFFLVKLLSFIPLDSELINVYVI